MKRTGFLARQRQWHVLYLVAAALFLANIVLLLLGVSPWLRLGVALLAATLVVVGIFRYRTSG